MSRTFTVKPAVRDTVPLLFGLMGPSGSGKTFSALRLATGMKKVCGGDIYVIDTEAKRSLHYADQFDFQHVEFGAPFSPLDYLECIEFCAKQGAKTIIIDSMSHEHEGPGGVLEMQEAELQRLGGEPRHNFAAWKVPKAARRRLLNSILQMPINFIFCFRAKEKMKPVPGRAPEDLGWLPIAGEDFIYEMTVNALLLPNCGGVPTWKGSTKSESAMIKQAGQFSSIFSDSKPLSESIGQSLAEWAKGVPQKSFEQLVTECEQAAEKGSESLKNWFLGLNAHQRAEITATKDKAKLRAQEVDKTL